MRLWARPRGGREPGHLPTAGPTHRSFFPPKDPAAPGSPAGSGTGPRPRPGGRSGGPDAARGGFQPGGRAAVARRRYCAQELGGGRDPARQGCGLTLRPPLPPAASSPPGGGPGSLPGLPAPIGVNGFGPLTPQTNGQPGSDSLYNNGLSPYPGGPSALPKSPRNGVGSGGWGVRGRRLRPWEGTPFSLLPLTTSLHLPTRLPSPWAPRPSLPSPEPWRG